MTHVAKDHQLNIHRGAHQAGDLVDLAIFFSAFRTPRTEYGTNGKIELFNGILWERFLNFLLINLFVDSNEFLQLIGRQVVIFFGFIFLFNIFEFDFEVVVLKSGVRTHHHVTEHIDEATVAIPTRTGISGLFDQTQYRLVGKSKVQNRVHHAGH